MKKTIVASICFFASITISMSQGSAVDYLQSMGKEFKAIQEAMWDYTKTAANNRGARKINKRRLELIQQVDASTKNVSRMGAFNKKNYLKDSVISYLKIQKIVLSEDYAKIMDLEEVAESSYDAMETYLKAREIADDKLEASFTRVDSAYVKFAKEHSIKLVNGEDDKIAKKLKVADEVYGHYNQVYLIFFKAFKQEVYFWDAVDRKDIAAMEQNKSSLASVSNEELEKLKTIKAYKGNDNSMIVAAREIITFYKSESELKLNKLIEYHTRTEVFEKAKKAFEANKDKTKEDIDEYNKLINEINKLSQEYNAINNELNKKRASLLNQWNNTSNSFTAKYL